MASKDTQTHLMLSQAQVSRIVASCMMCMVFVFVAGYYLGKKSQTEEFGEHMRQGAFADQIHSSLYTMYPDAQDPDTLYPGHEEQHEKKTNAVEGQTR